ncbi:MAG: GNAT family N-acetyltransferase [Gammaproteobacteria bacterium]|nr:GNAT family N-acetyltransferase [Gammaproteobacteria bacterium]MDE2347770.1 GNAT family N-acetyltransferase [Gammaproteobacteria bacterium]
MRAMKLPLRTPRLCVREFTRADFDGILAYSSDPRVTRYLFFGPRDEQSTIEYLDGLLESQLEAPRTRFELAVEELASGRLIGACDLSMIEGGVFDLGYMLGSDHWGKGYATEIALALVESAFLELRAQRVISTVDVNNRASIRVLEKIGMRWEAVFRKHRRAKNRWWDCHMYILPREVWESERADHERTVQRTAGRIKPS